MTKTRATPLSRVALFTALVLLFGCAPEPSFTLSASTLGALELGVKQTINLNASRQNLAASVPIFVVLESPRQGFTAEPVTIKESGTATFSISPTTVNTGSYTLTLKASTSEPPVSQTLTLEVEVKAPISTPALTVSSPDSLDIVAGSSQDITLNVTRYNFDGDVVITASDLPAGVGITPLTIPRGETSGSLTLNTEETARADSSLVTLTASSGELSGSSVFNLTVSTSQPPPPPPPTNLVIEDYVSGLAIPWDMAFSPDGALYISERKGGVKRYQDGALTDLSDTLDAANDANEGGLMGLAVDPDFSTNSRLYVCYSYRSGGAIKNRVSRVTVTDTALTNETILIDDMPGGTNHNGCRLAFGPDDTLYVTMGDTTKESLPQDAASPAGKVLRINRDGSVPADNPFDNEVWTLGHRNAQGLAFHPNGKLYSTEHGPADNDEINLIERGRNYGWPIVAGDCDDPTEATFCDSNNVKEPLTSYSPTLAVSDMVAYNGDMFPELKGKLLFVSLKEGQARVLTLGADGETVTNDEVLSFNDGVVNEISYDYGRLRDIAVGADGSIYIATSNQDGRGRTPFKDQPDRIIVFTKK